MITNPKIERKKTDIARTETKLAEVRAKLREQKHELIKLENDEIVAMFRNEVITEDDFSALMSSRREAGIDDGDESPDERISAKKDKEEKPDALLEN
jgi:hypothetical protein